MHMYQILTFSLSLSQTSDSVLFWTRGVAYTDEGSYTCRASNYLGSINQTQSIKVNGKTNNTVTIIIIIVSMYI